MAARFFHLALIRHVRLTFVSSHRMTIPPFRYLSPVAPPRVYHMRTHSSSPSNEHLLNQQAKGLLAKRLDAAAGWTREDTEELRRVLFSDDFIVHAYEEKLGWMECVWTNPQTQKSLHIHVHTGRGHMSQIEINGQHLGPMKGEWREFYSMVDTNVSLRTWIEFVEVVLMGREKGTIVKN